MSALERMLSRIEVVGECWQWPRVHTAGGYGQISVDGRTRLVHRFSYEALVGPVPPGLVLDHLCRNRACVNPDHLEPVTNAENLRRGRRRGPEATCRRGLHDMTDVYTHSGGRQCRPCRLAYMKQRHSGVL